jgi:hypothetical protein
MSLPYEARGLTTNAGQDVANDTNAGLAKGKWVTEEIVPGWRQQILVDELVVEVHAARIHIAH